MRESTARNCCHVLTQSAWSVWLELWPPLPETRSLGAQYAGSLSPYPGEVCRRCPPLSSSISCWIWCLARGERLCPNALPIQTRQVLCWSFMPRNHNWPQTEVFVGFCHPPAKSNSNNKSTKFCIGSNRNWVQLRRVLATIDLLLFVMIVHWRHNAYDRMFWHLFLGQIALLGHLRHSWNNLLFAQELLFCETCDSVFCSTCTGGTHKPAGGQEVPGDSTNTADHTVIPFSIAIKRMSEILIYKANECTAKVINLRNIWESSWSSLSGGMFQRNWIGIWYQFVLTTPTKFGTFVWRKCNQILEISYFTT